MGCSVKLEKSKTPRAFGGYLSISSKWCMASSGGGGGMEDLTGPLRSNDERSLYICSMKQMPMPVVPQSPDEEYCCELNHPDDTTTRTACAACSKGNSDLCYRASLTGEFLPAVMGCGVFGSQIVFAGGLKFNITTVDGPLKRRFGPDASSAVYGFETRDPNPTIKMSGRDRMFGEMFGKGSVIPCWWRFRGNSMLSPVFDPNFKKWSPLPAPPILEKGHISSSSLAIMGNFILMSTPNIPMVYGFDTENDAGWIEIGTPRFFCGRSLPFKGKALVVADNNGYFLFTFGSAIIVHFIGADHGQVIKELPLPQDVPVEFRKPDEPLYHRFIQLEGQKVCLVMTICTIEKLQVNCQEKIHAMRRGPCKLFHSLWPGHHFNIKLVVLKSASSVAAICSSAEEPPVLSYNKHHHLNNQNFCNQSVSPTSIFCTHH
ncbi:hypothetical protein Prudu_264S000200 [Prunus dulcis]|uniref:Uncharacterized protein n=1 Tax=Prunus dulcis TaxID=3755 RepID=A0A5H2XZD6_PRUDU|nr:hypothetical protein Prudu_264S000200 [Prunus dulcis]